MGRMRHNAIVVSSWNEPLMREIHGGARFLFGSHLVTNLTEEAVNGYRSFLVATDGSKEGWQESDEGDEKRAKFIEHLRKEYVYDDGSARVRWVEIQYGDDDNENKILQADDQALPDAEEG